MTRPGPRFLVPAVVALVVLGAVAWWLMRAPQEPALEASGTVEALEADLAFRYPGAIRSVAVEEGDRVEQDDTLAMLFADEQKAAHDAAAAAAEAAAQRLAELLHGARPQEIAQAGAARAAAATRLEEARAEAARARALYAGEAIPRRELERAETALAAATAEAVRTREQLDLLREGPRAEQIAAQRALVEQAQAAAQQAQATLDRATLVAPFTGVVTIRHRDPGETVSAGAPVVTVMDPGDRWVRIYIREDAIGRVRIGQAARITSDTRPARAYEGRVGFIAQEAEFTPTNVQTAEERVKLVYEVKVRVTGDPEGDLKVGTPADVTLLPQGE